MSRIEELIKEKCPDGVEYKQLNEVCDICGRIGFRGYTREDQVQAGEGAISLSPSNIKNGEIVFDNCTYISWYKYEESPEIQISVGDIIFGKTASVGKTALVKTLPEKATINPQLVLLKNIKCNNVYLSFVLKTYRFQSEIEKIKGLGTIPTISQKDLGKLEIPVPPIEVQQEIVRILDKFTELEAGLQAELDARKKQYEYYRDELLTFDEDVPVVKLEDVSDVYDSLHTTPAYVDEGYSMIRVADVKSGYVNTAVALKVDEETYKQYIKKYKPQFNDIIISRVGSFGNTCLIGEEDVCLGQNIAIIHSKISAKYLYYYLNTSKVRTYFDGNSNGAAYKNLSLARIKETPIAVPDLKTQEQIVCVLESLDTISGDAEKGLPAEIEARHKQYEYYRDKLLTFKRKEA